MEEKDSNSARDRMSKMQSNSLLKRNADSANVAFPSENAVRPFLFINVHQS